MPDAVSNLQAAMQRAMDVVPEARGFPYLAETLRRAGVYRNIWNLPGCQGIYLTTNGAVAMTLPALVTDMTEIPRFNREALISALRTDQKGKSTFEQFLRSVWYAGVVRYVIDFEARTCTYFGIDSEPYEEKFATVDVPERR